MANDNVLKHGADVNIRWCHEWLLSVCCAVQTYPLCRIGIQLCNSWDVSLVCQLSLQYCQTTQFAPIMAANPTMNVYDIRKECEGPLCYDFSRLDKYINQDSVRQKLGVGDRK